jgi:hypothetical protein
VDGLDSRLELPGPAHLRCFAKFNVGEAFAPHGQQCGDRSNFIAIALAIGARFEVVLQEGSIPRRNVPAKHGAKLFSIFAARVKERRHTC